MIMPSLTQWIIILVVVALVFGTGKLKNIGKDLGSAIKDFKSTMKDDDKGSSSTSGSAEEKSEKK